jgi:2-oxoglutarate ferredoxin oxidoreductase subunit gamma
MDNCKFIFSGSGGQGVVTAGIVLAEAAVLHENLHAIQTQSYGPEARGGATRSDVIISKSPINYPKVSYPNVLVCLTQESYNQFSLLVIPGGKIIIDSRFVTPTSSLDAIQTSYPMFESVAEHFGNPIVHNICMLGVTLQLTKIVKPESLMKVFESKMPPKLADINKKALQLGMKLASTEL